MGQPHYFLSSVMWTSRWTFALLQPLTQLHSLFCHVSSSLQAGYLLTDFSPLVSFNSGLFLSGGSLEVCALSSQMTAAADVWIDISPSFQTSLSLGLLCICFFMFFCFCVVSWFGSLNLINVWLKPEWESSGVSEAHQAEMFKNESCSPPLKEPVIHSFPQRVGCFCVSKWSVVAY